MSTSALNPAEETLLCDGPFEVLRLTPGVFRADEIKRQYRRLALALHPDKNRHPDAEAAFKKLAAAFEKLIDPAQQAACLAETKRKRARQNDRSDAGRAGGGMGWGPGVEKFPRWCKEGEYVPKEKTGEESTPDAAGQKERPMEDFLDDFAQQEAVFKEQVAQQAERLAERKRAKAEARAAAEQRRVDSLREDILGGSAGEEAAFEAKTASWQSFNSSTSRRRPNLASSASRKGGGGRGGRGGARTRTSNERSAEENAGVTKLGGGRGVGNRGQGGGGDGPAKDTKDTWGGVEFKCLVCRRGFKSVEGLARHEAQSELHRINVELSEVLSRG